MTQDTNIYDSLIGRFLSVDPLFEAFPNQSPYSYVLNNPLSFKDPSGLAPEKEKGNEMRIQASFFAPELQARYIAYLEEITRFQINLGESLYDDFVTENRESFERWKRLYSNGGGGSNGGSRLGLSSYTYIGQGFDENKCDIYFDFTVSIETHYGTLNIPTRLWGNGIAQGRSPFDIMDAHVNNINDVQQADPGYFNGLYGGNTRVEIDGYDNIYANGKKAVSKHFFDGNQSIITLAGDVLTGDITTPYTLIDEYSIKFLKNPDQYLVNHQPYSIIAHEFAHAIQAQCDYYAFRFQYNSSITEDFAISMTNKIRTYYGDPLQYNPNKPFWPSWNAFWFPNSWGKYLKSNY